MSYVGRMSCPVCGSDDYPDSHYLGVVLPDRRKRVSPWHVGLLAAVIVAGAVIVWKVLT